MLYLIVGIFEKYPMTKQQVILQTNSGSHDRRSHYKEDENTAPNPLSLGK